MYVKTKPRTWPLDARTKYGKNTKGPGEPWRRYNNYMHAKTVGEARKLGCQWKDFEYDIFHDLLEVNGGTWPVAQEIKNNSPIGSKRKRSNDQPLSETSKRKTFECISALAKRLKFYNRSHGLPSRTDVKSGYEIILL